MYRNAESGTDFIGGVDLVGVGTSVELQWIDKVQVLRIVGYDADTHDSRAPKKLRTLILKAKSGAGAPTLVEWQHALSWAHPALASSAKARRSFGSRSAMTELTDVTDATDVTDVTDVTDQAEDEIEEENEEAAAAGEEAVAAATTGAAAAADVHVTGTSPQTAAVRPPKASPKTKRRFGAVMRSGLRNGTLIAAVATLPMEEEAEATTHAENESAAAPRVGRARLLAVKLKKERAAARLPDGSLAPDMVPSSSLGEESATPLAVPTSSALSPGVLAATWAELQARAEV